MLPNLTADELGSFVRQTLELWHVPGAAVAVVKDGQVLLSEGYGLRDVDARLPVTAQTIFPIASCTKAFTAMCVALLVDEGKLEWDKPVRMYLPTFKLQDSFSTERMTPRDLLCHRSGLPRHDLVWYASNFSRRQVFERLQYLEPTKDLREAFQYQNMMYMVAGLLVGELTGMTWEAFLKQRIFDVLDMRRSNTSATATQADPDHGLPYKYHHDELKLLPYYGGEEEVATGPAGTICSCVSDLARWLAVHTGDGVAGERRFVSANNLEQMHQPHIFIDDPQGRRRFGFEFQSYGLGWFLQSQNGQVVVHHGGNIDGFSSLVSFLPRHGLGVAVLTNGDGIYNAIPSTISYTIYDRALGLEPTDWNARYREYYDEFVVALDRSVTHSAGRRQAAPPSHPLPDYVGDYEHPGYGVYAVRAHGEELQLVMNDKRAMPLAHYHYDIFEANFEAADMRLKLSFNTDTNGRIAGFAAQPEPMVKEVFFARRPSSALADDALLARLAGEYELQSLPLLITVREGKLFATLPGQEYELVPYQGTEFALKDHPGFSIEFKAGPAGTYDEAIVVQPGLLFVAPRKPA